MKLLQEELNDTVTININAWVVAAATVLVFVLGMWFESNTFVMSTLLTGSLTPAELAAEPTSDAEMVIDECTDGCTDEDAQDVDESASCGTSA